MNAPKSFTPRFGPFASLMWIVISAATAVTVVFGLFNSILQDLVPPYEDAKQSVLFVSLVCVVLLIVISVVLNKALSRAQGRLLAVGCGVLIVLTLGTFFPFRDMVREFVYRYPPQSLATVKQTRHVRGELHAEGQKAIGRRTVSEAVHSAGGPDFVDGEGLFWTEDSKRKVVGRMERLYVFLVILMTSTVFLSGLTLWRLSATSKGRSAKALR